MQLLTFYPHSLVVYADETKFKSTLNGLLQASIHWKKAQEEFVY